MRRLPYLGTYYGHLDVPMAALCGNFVIVDAATLLHTPGLLARILAFAHLKVVVQIHILDEVWRDDPGFEWVQLAHIREGLRAAGALGRVVGVIVDEECMLGAYAGTRFRHVPGARSSDPYTRVDWCHARWSDALRQVKAAFPGVPVGAVETCWYGRRDFGPAYYRPVLAEADFLGVDAYVHGPITREAFDRQVAPILAAAGSHGKPVLVVGQAFRDGDRQMPTAWQMQWWLDAAPPTTVGLAWFTLVHPGRDDPATHGDGRGLVDAPAQLEAARWYARVCGVVPA